VATHSVFIKNSAQKELRERIVEPIRQLAQAPCPQGTAYR
jgi:hypothetical protein